MKIRNFWVSNSSSSSFIVINKPKDKNYYIDQIKSKYARNSLLIVDETIGCTEFGWDHRHYYDFGSKVIFAWLQATYVKNEEWLKMLEEVLRENLDVTQIEWNLSTEYDGELEYAFIDHQSASYEDSNTQMFDSKENLKTSSFAMTALF